jgi:hypothetical protein
VHRQLDGTFAQQAPNQQQTMPSLPVVPEEAAGQQRPPPPAALRPHQQQAAMQQWPVLMYSGPYKG